MAHILTSMIEASLVLGRVLKSEPNSRVDGGDMEGFAAVCPVSGAFASWLSRVLGHSSCFTRDLHIFRLWFHRLLCFSSQMIPGSLWLTRWPAPKEVK